MLVHNRYGGCGVELYCAHCRRKEIGIEREIYLWAAWFVDVSGFDYFPEIETASERRARNVAKVGELAAWYLRRAGHLTDDGLSEEFLRRFAHWRDTDGGA